MRPFFIVGSTAVGKSDLAAEVAASYDGEILGADAFQVYEGFNLLTAKPSRDILQRAPHHLIGVIPPARAYNVAEYHADAQHCLEDIAKRGKRAVVVGGSGLYIKALTHGLSPLPAAQTALREELDALALPQLLARLEALDPVAATKIDAKNKRRLVRALEVCLVTGNRFSDYQELWTRVASEDSALFGVWVNRDRAELHERIERRVASMFPAVLDEVRSMPREAVGPTAAKMIGLRELWDCLDGRMTQAECKERITVATRQYAKRQMTWFKREKGFVTLDLSATKNLPSAAGAILETVLSRE